VADRDAVVDPFSTGDAPGRLARVILLAHALGEDPTAVGAGPGDDLVARLLATEQTSGADEGLFGDPVTQSPTYDGAFRQGYSLAALDAAGVTSSPAASQWLLTQQCSDGSWMPYRAEVSPGVLQACAFDAVAFVGPDSNSTAAALNGLGYALPGDAAITTGAAWLATVQNADGGWGLFPGDVSEPSSTALVWQALAFTGFGSDPTYLGKAAVPLQTLLSFQLGCTSPTEDRGALTYPGSNDAPNGFSTAQATPALAGVPLVFGPVTAAAALPVVDCSVPTTTTTTTAAPGASTTTTTPVTTTTTRPASAANAGAARPINFVG
jgi:Squalene-hopene cyclase C-terminal domain